MLSTLAAKGKRVSTGKPIAVLTVGVFIIIIIKTAILQYWCRAHK